MEIVRIGWRATFTKDEGYATMVIKITDSVMDNAILGELLVVGRQIRACSVFNKACMSIQCFVRSYRFLEHQKLYGSYRGRLSD